jgi:hypothetical protein
VAKSAIQVKWYPLTNIDFKTAETMRKHALCDIRRWKKGLQSLNMEVDWSNLTVDFWIVSPSIDPVLQKQIVDDDHCRYTVTINSTKDWVERIGAIAEGLMRETSPHLF